MGFSQEITSRAKEAQLEITVTRADGRVERLGTVAYWHRNPLKRWLWRLKRFLGRD
jgi:hypothetical protein